MILTQQCEQINPGSQKWQPAVSINNTSGVKCSVNEMHALDISVTDIKEEIKCLKLITKYLFLIFDTLGDCLAQKQQLINTRCVR